MATGDYSRGSGEVRSRAIIERRPVQRVAPGARLKLSPAVVQMVERARTVFGIALEVLDSNLRPVLPEAGGELYRAVEASPRTQAAVAAVLEAGRSRVVQIGEAAFLLQPLSGGRGSRAAVGVLGIPRAPMPAADGALSGTEEVSERWVDFLRIAIESDLALTETLRDERLQARRSLGVLRFLGQLGTIRTELELAQAVVHAAAVWFDVDARLYRRNLAGDLALHTHLPGIADASEAVRLESPLLAEPLRTPRIVNSDDIEGLRWASPQALLVPVHVENGAEWLLVLGGVLPPGVQVVFETVGDTMGAHLTRLAVHYRAAVRGRFEQIVLRDGRPRELAVLDVLRQLIEETGAASGVVTVFEDGRSRRLAAVGTLATIDVPPSEPLLAFDQIVYPIELANDRRAVIALMAPPDGAFADHAPTIVSVAASVIQVFLASSHTEPVAELVDTAAAAHAAPAFVARITEELERAKRFDLGLSMLLIDIQPHGTEADTIRHVVESVRAELRGSDLLGVVGRGRIAALLVHTGATGVGSVVSRVRRRLELLLEGLGLPALSLGRAVLSQDCRTTADLLSRASRDIEPVVAT
jgi:hypothetical protein